MADPKNPAAGIPLPEALAGNFQDAARWFNQLWGGGIDPARMGAGAVPSMMMPTMDVKELDKRIADLKSVEQWLQLNAGLLHTTIQGLEMQRNALHAWQGLGAGAASAAEAMAQAGSAAADNPAFQPAAWWNALQQQFAQMAANAVAQESPPAAPEPKPGTATKAGAGKPRG